MKTVVLRWLLAPILFPPTPFLQLSSFRFDTLMFFLKKKNNLKTLSQFKSNMYCQSNTFFFHSFVFLVLF